MAKICYLKSQKLKCWQTGSMCWLWFFNERITAYQYKEKNICCYLFTDIVIKSPITDSILFNNAAWTTYVMWCQLWKIEVTMCPVVFCFVTKKPITSRSDIMNNVRHQRMKWFVQSVGYHIGLRSSNSISLLGWDRHTHTHTHTHARASKWWNYASDLHVGQDNAACLITETVLRDNESKFHLDLLTWKTFLLLSDLYLSSSPDVLTMVLYYCDLLFGLYPSSLCSLTTTFQGMFLPSPSGEPTLLGPSDRASLYRWTLSTKHTGLYISTVRRSVCVLQCEELILKLYQHA
jgi:hypothetical protein